MTFNTFSPLSSGDVILSKRQVATLTGLSVSTIDRRPPGFPEPIELSARRVGWLRSSVEAWLRSRPPRAVAKRIGAKHGRAR